MKSKQFFKNKLGKSKGVLGMVIACSAILTLLTAYTLAPMQFVTTAQGAPAPLPPLTIPKFVNQLTGPPPIYVPDTNENYSVSMVAFDQQVLPLMIFPGETVEEYRTTRVWGYNGTAKDAVTGTLLGYVANSPGPSFNVSKGTPIWVNWTNKITEPQPFAIDPTLHWANPNNIPMPYPPAANPPYFPAFPPGIPAAQQSPVPLVTHLHGGEVPPESDGGPDAWWTSSGIQGPGYSTRVPTTDNSAVYYYPNINPASTLWYHDHALGITRLNVMSGLAGFYIVNDPADTTVAPLLPTGKYDMPLVFQDRTFWDNGSFIFPSLGVQPQKHPYWVPEFFGDTIMVNGLVWPNMDVDQAAYRFRLLDGSNARFYTISFVANAGTPTETILPFTQIASDGGYLTAPVYDMTQLTFAPGERVEILVDFSGLPAGTKILLKNTANENFPFGLPVNPATVGQLMQFTVTGTAGAAAPTLPAGLNPTLPVFPTLLAPRVTRILTLVEVLDAFTGVPVELLLDGQVWGSPTTENATVGDTEDWMIFNPTADSHPIHLHLVQFQLISRIAFNVKKYYADWLALNGLPPNGGIITGPTKNLPNLYKYIGMPVARIAPPSEQGWKDTIMMHPGEVTTIRIRFAPVEAPVVANPILPVNSYPFDPTAPHGTGTGPGPTGPISYGYVWHCHILDHEDNEMMRPLALTNAVIPAVPPPWLPPKGQPPVVPPPRPR